MLRKEINKTSFTHNYKYHSIPFYPFLKKYDTPAARLCDPSARSIDNTGILPRSYIYILLWSGYILKLFLRLQGITSPAHLCEPGARHNENMGILPRSYINIAFPHLGYILFRSEILMKLLSLKQKTFCLKERKIQLRKYIIR